MSEYTVVMLLVLVPWILAAIAIGMNIKTAVEIGVLQSRMEQQEDLTMKILLENINE